MPKLTPRQIIGYGVWFISFFIGFVITALLVFVALDTDLDRFGMSLFVLSTISLAMVFVIWLDYLLGTKILPD